MKGASGFRFLPWVEGLRVWEGKCFRVPSPSPSPREQRSHRIEHAPLEGGDRGGGGGLEWKVFPGFDSCPGWKGSGFGMEGAPGLRFLPRVGRFRGWYERCFHPEK